MAYLNADNWEHCQDFVDYLIELHTKGGAQPSRLQQLNDLCQKVPGRSYLATLKNLFSSGLDKTQNADFVNTIKSWMNENDFIQHQKTKHQKPVRFSDDYAPNLAYAFEYFIRKQTSNNDYTKSIPFADSMMEWVYREIFQPRWQKALILALVLAMTVMSVLSMGGLLPVSFFAMSGICMVFCAVGGGALYFESEENNGLFTQQKQVVGARNFENSGVRDFKYNSENKKPTQQMGTYQGIFSAENQKQAENQNNPESPLKISANKK